MRHLVQTRHWSVVAYRFKSNDRPYPLLFVGAIRGYARGVEVAVVGFHVGVAHVR